MFKKTVLGLSALVVLVTSTTAFAFTEPKSRGAGHLPEAYYSQQQDGYPQSPPGGGF